MQRFSPRSLVLLSGLALLGACGDDPAEPSADPGSIEITAGNNQMGGTNAAVAVAPTVRVLDEDGAPVENLTVTFAVATGGGTITGATPKTSATGHASVGSWTLGTNGGINTLTATVSGLPAATFSATAQGASATPANVVLYIGGGQTAQVGSPVPVAPTVLVTDAGGQPVHFATVTFSVEGGGGTATGTTRTTNEQGLAKVESWKLGPTAGVNTLRATVAGLPPVDVAATGRALDAGRFNLTLRFVSIVSPAQYAVFEAARARWEEVIIGELANIPVSSSQVLCTGAPTASETIDDVVIFVNLVDIDGPGSVLGSAGPCAVRTSNGLPIAGVMNFDTADLAAMTPAVFQDVILHEMGHVIGIGSLWNLTNPVRTLLTGAGGDTPYFNGAGAISSFDLAGGDIWVGTDRVPVENCIAPTTCSGDGQGTRDSHWRESVLGNELMTGFISGSGINPLSSVTISSLDDMGYTVAAAEAEAYTVPSSSLRMHAGEMMHEMTEAPLTSPILVMNESGRVEGSVARR